MAALELLPFYQAVYSTEYSVYEVLDSLLKTAVGKIAVGKTPSIR